MRLIDADELYKKLYEVRKEEVKLYGVRNSIFCCTLSTALTEIDYAPTIEERKTGKWVESDTDGFVCSVCRNGYRCQPTLMGKPMFEYCPVCGAKMEAET